MKHSYQLLLVFFSSINIILGLQYYDIQQFLGKQRNWSSQIKTCINSCKKMLSRGNRDMNYCIEGCRIRVYRPIYSCVFEQCNNRGLGVSETLYPSKYHQCVHLCKLRPSNKQKLKTTTRPQQWESTQKQNSIEEFHYAN